ncbi:MAG: hypothetical protein JWO99_638 [Candidatus Saccharibacteria bacterium]|nr:hypothetical protein [Candidatus Saccharibacteria bacterium]
MNNSNDQAQFAKDMYQFPSHKAEVSDTPELSDEQQVDRQFTDIAREETRLAFEAISKELAMVASGIELPKDVQIETPEIHQDAVEILHIGNSVKSMRETRHAELIEIQTKRGFTRIVGLALGTTSGVSDTFKSKKALDTKQVILHDLIEQESKIGSTVFPTDPDVTSRKFFYLPSETKDEWFHQQTSPVPAKDFTNSYTITPHSIEKSSTFMDPVEGRVKNVSVVPDDTEVKNLKLAATHYHHHVAQKMYKKPTSSRRRFGLKSDYDLTA